MVALTLIADMPTLGVLLVVGITWAVLAPLLLAGAGAATGTAAAIQANRNRQSAEQASEANRGQSETQFTRDQAYQASLVNPFRQQMFQGRSLAQLELLRQAGQQQQPSVSGIPYANQSMIANVPRLTPQTLAALEALQANIMAGQTAPDYTKPHNTGQSAVLNLTGVANGTVDPSVARAYDTTGMVTTTPGGQRLTNPALIAKLRANNPSTGMHPIRGTNIGGLQRRQPGGTAVRDRSARPV